MKQDGRKLENEKQTMNNGSNQCLTFTSHELFWKELETIAEDGALLEKDEG